MNISSRGLVTQSRKFTFFLALLASYALFALPFSPRASLPYTLIFALLAAVLSVAFLDGTDHFGFDPRPRRSTLFILLLSLPLPGFFAKWFTVFLFNRDILTYRSVLLVSMCVAVACTIFGYAEARLRRRFGGPWKIFVRVMPNELAELRAELSLHDRASWFTLVPHVAEQKPQEVAGGYLWLISRGAVKDLRSVPELIHAQLAGEPIVDVRDFLCAFRGRVSLQNTDGWSFLVGSIGKTYLVRAYFAAKTWVEPVLALAALILLSPLFLLIAALVKFTSPGPVIYRQKRTGYQERVFDLLKFRSMYTDAESAGPRWAAHGDDRITPVGRHLRRSRLDELPQLLNVLLGHLSFVGPRPERPEFYESLGREIPQFSLRLLVRPGITGWAQVNYGYAASVDESRKKLEYDLYYMQNMSPALDFRVILLTAGLMLRGSSGR